MSPARTWWYATAEFGRWRDRRVELRFEPTSRVHARQFGSPNTACGLVAASWRRYRDVAFPGPWEPTCATCEAVVAAASPVNSDA